MTKTIEERAEELIRYAETIGVQFEPGIRAELTKAGIGTLRSLERDTVEAAAKVAVTQAMEWDGGSLIGLDIASSIRQLSGKGN